jgi:LacI family transcriptional regulator
METIQNKKVRLSDVAKIAKVSIPTASMALANNPEISEETCRRIQMISKKLGYLRPGERSQPSRQIDETKSLRFGYLLIGKSLTDEVVIGCLRDMSRQASALRVRLELKAIEDVSNPQSVEIQMLEFIRELDGVVLEGLMNKSFLKTVEETHVPYVVLGHIMTKPGEVPPEFGHFVDWNVQAMGQLATARLLACGHRRIGFFCEKVFHGMWNYHWIMGYHDAHWELNLPVESSLIHVAGKAFAGGEPAADYFSKMENPPTAYICPDVRIAASFFSSMAKRGTVITPGNLIIGGTPEVVPKYHMEGFPLIGQDSENLGKVVIDTLHQLHQNPAVGSRLIQLPFSTQNLPEPRQEEKL